MITNMMMGELCDIISNNLIYDTEYFNTLSLIRNVALCSDADLLLHKTKRIVVRDFDYIKTYDGEIKDNYVCFTIGCTMDGIVGMMTKNNMEILEAFIEVDCFKKYLSFEYISILRHIADFAKYELPFLPFKFGLTSNKEIKVSIRIDFMDEYKLVVMYKKNIEIQNIYLDYSIYKIHSVGNTINTLTLTEKVGNVLVNYIASPSDEISIETDDERIDVKHSSVNEELNLFEFSPDYLNYMYGLKIDKYNNCKLKFNNPSLTFVIIKVLHIV